MNSALELLVLLLGAILFIFFFFPEDLGASAGRLVSAYRAVAGD